MYHMTFLGFKFTYTCLCQCRAVWKDPVRSGSGDFRSWSVLSGPYPVLIGPGSVPGPVQLIRSGQSWSTRSVLFGHGPTLARPGRFGSISLQLPYIILSLCIQILSLLKTS